MTRNRLLTAALVAGLVVWVVYGLVVVPAGTAVAANNSTNISDKAPYYNSSNASVDNASWTQGQENATLENTLDYAVRIGPYVVGTGSGGPGIGAPGALLTGLVVAGAVAGVSSSSRLGFVGGGVVGTMTIAALVAVGLAPQWLYVIVIMLIGLLVATAVFRTR